MRLKELQDKFVAALRDPDEKVDLPIKQGWLDPAQRFSIYRNNFRIGLTEALACNFPITLALVDRTFFEPIAWQFIRQTPPHEPTVFSYGLEFPEFLQNLPSLQSYPFIAEVCRFEYLMNKLAHIEDQTENRPVDLAALTSEELAESWFIVSERLAIMEAQYPVLEIWRAHQDDPEKLAEVELRAEKNWLLLYRWENRLHFSTLHQADYLFLHQMKAGLNLDHILEHVLADHPDFELARLLSLIITYRLARPVSEKQRNEPPISKQLN